jgi:adenosine deaminase
MKKTSTLNKKLYFELTKIISETNGLSVLDTMELLYYSMEQKGEKELAQLAQEFRDNLYAYQQDKIKIQTLLDHPLSHAFFHFFKSFPLKYTEEHIHLTGSLSPEFVYEHLKPILEGAHGAEVLKKIRQVYRQEKASIGSVKDVHNLIALKDHERFEEYLRILYLPKVILTSREIHLKAAYHMARTLYHHYNVGTIRLKFTLSRASGSSDDQIPGMPEVTEEDVLFGLYEGFKTFQLEHPDFKFTLSPCFRKEAWFYDQKNFSSKREHFMHQVDSILKILEDHPYLVPHLDEVDTVGDEKELYRKAHFEEMKGGFRRLQYNGFKIRSHHGETWKVLRKGVQSVDNAMNIWHIDNLEHGLSLGINPNYYYHRLFERVMGKNKKGEAIDANSLEGQEIEDMNWVDTPIKEKLLKGIKINTEEETSFVKTKFHHAREMEHYQHDVLNRMIDKGVSLVALPSSNMKLTEAFPDYKDHPFSWWEKKGVNLGVGTDNYVTLNTNFIQEMLILLYSDPADLKITKLLMVTTKETRRAFISHLLWEMRKSAQL